MIDTKHITDMIKAGAASGERRELTGRNALLKDLFEYFFSRSGFKYDLLLLCTKSGLILSCKSKKQQDDFSGYSVSMDMFSEYKDELIFDNSVEGCTLIAAVPEGSAEQIDRLQTSIKLMLSMLDTYSAGERHLLDCFDIVDNPICIYDKNACLLYGNTSYFDNMQIRDRDGALGMNILDITKKSGIKIHATRSGSNDLKMLEVLKTGKKALDWEVMIETQTSTNKANFTSNNMYPIKDRNGNVDGMIEIAYSHQVSLNKTKKLMGFNAEYTFESIIGESPAISNAVEHAKEYADSPYNLLIVGESGVGKELFAQSVHNYSDRRHGPFVAINCASFPENLIESELFGYVGGAFTGASKNGQMGKFELADGGTLFLDEIGELPYHFQSKLLRVLETSKITRIGSTQQTPVNVRVIAATNRALEQMIAEGVFRKDLYYRLQVLNIEIPPLRDRGKDILLLTNSFFKQAAEASGDEPKSLDRSAENCLMSYDWPGNVRELRNVIHRVTLLSASDVINKETLEAAINSKSYALKAEDSSTPEERLEKRMNDVNGSYAKLINEALDIAGGNKSKAADLLDVSRMTFYRMMEKYL